MSTLRSVVQEQAADEVPQTAPAHLSHMMAYEDSEEFNFTRAERQG